MGLLNTSAIVTRYAGPGFSQVIMNVFHPMLGVLLFSALDTEVDAYSVGFYRDPNDEMENRYIVHNFNDNPNSLALFGIPAGTPNLPMNTPLLHGREVTLTAHDNVPLPPSGVFDWHYLQCLIKRFGTASLKSVNNIKFYELPFKTEDDDDESWDDDIEGEGPYPTYHFDVAVSKRAALQEASEKRKAVELWSEGVDTT